MKIERSMFDFHGMSFFIQEHDGRAADYAADYKEALFSTISFLIFSTKSAVPMSSVFSFPRVRTLTLLASDSLSPTTSKNGTFCNEKMNAKIREHAMQKVPFLLVVGDKESDANKVNVRTRGKEKTEDMGTADFVEKIRKLIVEKSASL